MNQRNLIDHVVPLLPDVNLPTRSEGSYVLDVSYYHAGIKDRVVTINQSAFWFVIDGGIFGWYL